jgi:hypothetical protein
MGILHLKRGQSGKSVATVLNMLSSLLFLLLLLLLMMMIIIIIKIMMTKTTNYGDDDVEKCNIVTSTFTPLFPVPVCPGNNACSMTKAE